MSHHSTKRNPISYAHSRPKTPQSRTVQYGNKVVDPSAAGLSPAAAPHMFLTTPPPPTRDCQPHIDRHWAVHDHTTTTQMGDRSESFSPSQNDTTNTTNTTNTPTTNTTRTTPTNTPTSTTTTAAQRLACIITTTTAYLLVQYRPQT